MNWGFLRKSLVVVVFGLVSTALLASGSWQVLGPDGGDARSLAYDSHNPDHMLLGTSTGQLFVSNDAGHSWSRFARLGGDDYVLDHIAIDPQNPKHIYVSAWSVSSQQIGDVFRTRDGGKNWETLSAMHGKSIRAMAMFHGNSKVLVAGALDGVFRSMDGGDSWERMSPVNHADIKNIESIAVDPKDPNTVYAGTWHLAWKTADGGASWQQIKKGMIDDSDVFSVIVDHSNASVVFASACSGIYKSESAGNQFSKIQGIPFSARRTRVLKQDPTNENIVYAGTTEGLWKTSDLGKTWKRVSNPEIVVNDVLVDPRDSNNVLLATDRSGVMASNDGTQSWTTSNKGYAHRYVSALLADAKDGNTFYVGLVNDREFGGVFFTRDAGHTWLQRSAGLGGRDIFALKQAASGTLVAGTNRGMFALDRNATQWRSMNSVVTEQIVKAAKKGSKKAWVRSAGLPRPPRASTAARTRVNHGRAGRYWDRRILSRCGRRDPSWWPRHDPMRWFPMTLAQPGNNPGCLPIWSGSAAARLAPMAGSSSLRTKASIAVATAASDGSMSRTGCRARTSPRSASTHRTIGCWRRAVPPA